LSRPHHRWLIEKAESIEEEGGAIPETPHEIIIRQHP